MLRLKSHRPTGRVAGAGAINDKTMCLDPCHKTALFGIPARAQERTSAPAGENRPLAVVLPRDGRSRQPLPKACPKHHPIISYRTVLARWPDGRPPRLRKGPPPEQKAHLQTDALKKAGRTRVGTEKASGSSTTAPSWKRSSITSAPPVPSWRLDRLGDQTKSSPSWLSSPAIRAHTSEGSQYRPDPPSAQHGEGRYPWRASMSPTVA